jgi:hypothetical protein
VEPLSSSAHADLRLGRKTRCWKRRARACGNSLRFYRLR